MTIFFAREEGARIVTRSTKGVRVCILFEVENRFESRFKTMMHVCDDGLSLDG